MAEGSDKHGPVLDEQLKKEAESIQGDHGTAVTAGHREGWGTGQEIPDDQGRRTDRPTEANLSHTEAEQRAELAKHLQTVAFPGDKEALIASALEMQASERIVGMLDALPAGETFENIQAVWAALGGKVESGRA